MIHPTAIIDSKAELDSSVEVGPYSIIGAGVSIDAGTHIGPHVVIEGPTKIGKNNRIFQFASLGAEPQDMKYRGEPTSLIIGDNNTIREFVTFNRGTVQDEGVTKVGDSNWIMAYIHIAHDCVIGNHTIMANNVTLAGHAHIEDHVVMGGFSMVYQFARIGAYSMVGYTAGCKSNVPPFSTVVDSPARNAGINALGLRRNGFTQEEIETIKHCFHILYQENLLLNDAREKIGEIAKTAPYVQRLYDFLGNLGKRGLTR